MVEGITSGLGAAADRGTPFRAWGGSSDDYRYEWDPRWGRRRGGNAENSSRVEQPEGESFEFQENRVVFSKLSGHAPRALEGPGQLVLRFHPSGRDLTDSAIVDSSLAGASVHELLMEGSEMKDVVIAGLQDQPAGAAGGSGMKNVKISGSSVLEFHAWKRQPDRGHAALRESRSTAAAFLEKTLVKDTRLQRHGREPLHTRGGDAVRHADRRMHAGATRTWPTPRSPGARSAACQPPGFEASRARRIKDSRLEAVGFSALKIERSELKNVAIRDAFDGRIPRERPRISASWT